MCAVIGTVTDKRTMSENQNAPGSCKGITLIFTSTVRFLSSDLSCPAVAVWR